MPTGTVKRIVCLANSRKLSGRCIAGKELLGDGSSSQWIRPVSARETEEVSEYERQFEDGSDPRVLDVVDVPLLDAVPKNYQQENWLLDPNNYWERVGKVAWNELGQYTDPVRPLWNNGHNNFNGLNDQVPEANALSLRHSLRLVRVNDLALAVFPPGQTFGNSKRRVQGDSITVAMNTGCGSPTLIPSGNTYKCRTVTTQSAMLF